MRTLLYIFSVRNAIKRKKDLFSLKRSATCAMAKNNLLKRFATSARAEVAQLALCASNCGMPTSAMHHVFFDNFFSSYDLMVKLDKKGFRATGTVRENRLKKCTITSTTELKKKLKGSFDFRSHGNIEVVRWNDNSVVTLCNNTEGVEPVGEVKRRMKGRGVLDVQQPYVVGYDHTTAGWE